MSCKWRMDKRIVVYQPGPQLEQIPWATAFRGFQKGPTGSGRGCSQALPPRERWRSPIQADASHCALSRFLPTYTFQMLFVLPASHGLRPSDKLVLWTYVVAIMGMLTPHSLPAGARQLVPRPDAWHALFSATGPFPAPQIHHTHGPPIRISVDVPLPGMPALPLLHLALPY